MLRYFLFVSSAVDPHRNSSLRQLLAGKLGEREGEGAFLTLALVIDSVGNRFIGARGAGLAARYIRDWRARRRLERG